MTAASNYRSADAERAALANYERVIRIWPIAFTCHSLQTSVGPTFVLEFGDADLPPLVMLHGSAANSATWTGDAANYARHFHCFAIDLPGETGKSTPVRPSYHGDSYVRWLEEVLDALHLERTAIVGLSLGGWVGLRFAAAQPQRVERLALISTGGVVPARRSFIAKALLFRPLGGWGIRRLTALICHPQPVPPGMEEVFAFMLRNYRARRDALPVIPDAELQQVTPPVYFIGGCEDTLLDMRQAEARLANLAPRSSSMLVPVGGHALIGAAPYVIEFLTRDGP